MANKTRVKVPNVLDTIFLRTRIPKSVFYLTEGGLNGKEPRNVLDEAPPYMCPPEQTSHVYRTLLSNWKTRDAAIDRAEGNAFSTRQNRDLRARIHIPTGDEDKEIEFMGILDIDPQYFTILQNRPIRTKFSSREYVRDIRSTLLARLETDMMYDEAIKKKEYSELQQYHIDIVRDRQEMYMHAFEKFLGDDFESASKELQISGEIAFKTKELQIQRDQLQIEIGLIECDLFEMNERWETLLNYQHVLYRVAPLSWRTQHDWIHRDTYGNLHNVIVNSDISLVSEHSLATVVTNFVNYMAVAPEPKMPFTDPAELLNIIDEYANNTLSSLVVFENIAGPLAGVKAGFEHAKKKIEIELDLLKHNIDRLSTDIVWEEKRGQSLKERGEQLLAGGLQKLFKVGPHLFSPVWVEDAYEGAVGQNDVGLSTLVMATGLEKQMHAMEKELDHLPLNCVIEAERQVIQSEEDMWMKAKTADQHLKAISEMMKNTKRNMGPVKPWGPRRLVPRSDLPPPVEKPPTPPRTITSYEKELLDFFSDWCYYEDVDAYLSSIDNDVVPSECNFDIGSL